MRIEPVAWDDPRAVALRDAMDAEMSVRYDVVDGQPAPRALTVDPATIVAVGLAVGDAPVGHAALRDRPDLGALELKRLVVTADARGRGIATALLAWVEVTARSLDASRLVLHTGERQPEAIALYGNLGWTHVPVFPPYEELAFSVCFAKDL